VTAVIEAYIEGSSPVHCNAGSWLHPPAPSQTGSKQFREERTDGCLRVCLRDLCKPNYATPNAIRKSLTIKLETYMIHNILPVVHEGEFVFVFITHHEDDPNVSCHQLLCIYRMIGAGLEGQVLSPSLALIGGYTSSIRLSFML
jgi:hypothetical protein